MRVRPEPHQRFRRAVPAPTDHGEQVRPSGHFRSLWPCLVELPLRSAWSRAILCVGAGLTAFLIAGEALGIAVVAALADSLDPQRVQAALALDPANPGLERRLGQVYLYVMDRVDGPEAVRHFRRAVELNSRLAASWAALGSACDLTRDTVCSDQAFEQALKLNPMTPGLRWVVGNHYLSTNRSKAALAHFHRLLELNPRYATQTFALCLRVLDDPQLIFQRVVPRASGDPKLSLAFISFLSANGKPDDAYTAWQKTAAEALPFDFSLVRPFLDSLIDRGEYAKAASVWRDLERLGMIQRSDQGRSGNLVFNGGFELAPLNSGLDWHFRKEPYLALDFSDPSAYEGSACLRVDFTVSRNEEHEPVYEIVPVLPGRNYSLVAYVRSEDISSDSGPRLRVLDPRCYECLDASTATTLATTGWHPISMKFTAGPQTRYVRLSLWRSRSRTFPPDIGGRFWMDAVSVKLDDQDGKSAGPPS